MNLRILFLLVVVIFLTSCQTKILFTYDIKEKLEEKDLDVKKVQFYNSDKIVLTRNMPHDEAIVADGEVRFENGQYIEEVIINRGTPGVCLVDNDVIMGISFEDGSKILNFKVDRNSNFFSLEFERKADLISKVFYDNQVYTVEPVGEKAKLLIRKNDKYVYQINQRIAEGVIVK